MHVLTPQERGRLDEAGRLAMQHKPDEAMRIYNQIFGNEPPSGKWAEPYYETEAASTGGRQKAIAQLRRLCARDRNNEMYRLWLTRVLVYDPKTRMEGFQLLESLHDPGAVEQARTEWRQALLWEKENPAVLASLDAYLQRYPDQELQNIQKSLREKQEHAEEEASKEHGFQALRNKDMGMAEAKFADVLRRSPNDANAIAGMAFVRLNQKRFDEAVTLFDRARTLAPKRADLREGYENAKFWSLMQQGATALDQNRTDAAIADYQQALTLKPGAPDALHGLAGATERKRNYSEAAQAYTQLTVANPADAQSWLGLIRAQIGAKNPKAAIETAQRIPPTTKSQIETRTDYLSEMALAYYSTNQPAEGDRALRQAMEAATQSDTNDALNVRLEVASALVDQGKMDRAFEIYRQATRLHPDNAIAWQGLIGGYTRMRDFAQAKAAVRSMPQNTYEIATKNTSFLNSVAAIYSADGQCSEAEDFLNRSLSLEKAAGHEPAESTQLQLVDIWMREGNYGKAREGYRQIIARDQNATDAWRGYITALHSQQDDRGVLAEAQRIPASIRMQLEKEPSFLTLLASAYSALGQNAQTIQLLQQARTRFQAQGQVPPGELDVQLAWAMLTDRQRDPRDFLSKVKARADLTDKQRAAINEIWSTWSVRTAEEAQQNKKPERAIAVLTDAERELPNDPKIYAALASVYMRQHDYQRALSVYELWGMTGAEAGDYRAAAGTALAAHKSDLADHFLEQGLQHYPNDPDLLQMTAKQAVAHGKYKEAQGYLKSALRATRNPETQRQTFAQESTSQRGFTSTDRGSDSATGLTAPSSQMPACRQTTSYRMPQDFHVQLVSANLDDQENASPNGVNQSNGNQSNPSKANQNQSNTDQSNANQDSVNPQANAEKQQQIQDQIDVVQNRNTPFADVGSAATGRAGDAGIDRLIIEDGTIGGSVTGANTVRLSVLAHGVYLFSGTPNGQSKFQFGTLPRGATFGQQTTAGVAGEVQISTATFGLDFGVSPQGFPVENLTGGIRFRPLGGPFTFLAVRDSVKDSLLSYAGVRDPGTGIIWGGVVSNTGTLQLDHKGTRAGQYASASGSYITGKNVPNNWAVSGNAGLYFVVAKGLSLGINLTGMHYQKNLSFFSLGQGGYSSPQEYGLASIPISWFSRHKRFEYEIRASLGAQYFSQERSPFFPTRINAVLPAQGFFASNHSAGPNYNFLARLGYRVAPHVYFDIFGTANNARNYATQTVGFSLKFLVHRLPTNTDLHVNSIPDWRGNQPFGIE